MNNILPVITLYQPWATWIMRGWKTIETRKHSRFASLNGKTILIHAGQTTDNSDYAVRNLYLTKEQICNEPMEIINGAILGKVVVFDFRRLRTFNENDALIECSTERYGLFLKDISPFAAPVYCKGEMGIWYFDMDKMEKVRKKSKSTKQPNLF